MLTTSLIMVNNINKKKQILDILRDSSTPVSGELIAEKLNFTRVALWKHINYLREAGYKIESGSRGYIIDRSDDYLYPWEFPDYHKNIIHFEKIFSTMDAAVEKEYDDGTVIVAEEQKDGRGTKGRKWDSAYGGLFFTIVNRKEKPAHLYLSDSFYISTVLYRIFQEDYNLSVKLKWPNDILINDKKAGGILLETFISGDRCKFVNAGVGLNINNSPENGISISSVLGRKISRREILERFLKLYYKDKNSDDQISLYRSLVKKSNLNLKYRINDKIIKGKLLDVTNTGAAIVDNNGIRVKIYPGDRENG